ncbi:hypothetical protein PF327_10830 [Sulfurovum sp. XTW-4]|uniref:DUF4055 domain-containing protein n=1 Tax=Sulfurovum xiamenensis TaxID=3019066 RepID=A0ABT7QUQ2_9BACT|nr:hypothetical protein [Sulfurovum xiamenensis]MDM5264689.1 hypothetical protein [Sulfurovum xiamenensis]
MSVPEFKIKDTTVIAQSKKCNDVYVGANRVQEYLIKSNSESTIEFNSRKSIASCGTTFKKGINSIVDILFKTEITIDEKVSPKLTKYYETADGKQSLNKIAKTLLKQLLLSNKVYVLVWTPVNDAKNAKEEEQKGIRPYIEIITRDRVMDNILKRDSLGNIVHIAIAGSYVESETRYETKTNNEYRVYFNDGITEIFRETKDGVSLYQTVQSEVEELNIIELTMDEVNDIPNFINEANYQLQHYNIESAKDSYNKKLAFPFVVTWGMMSNSSGIATEKTDDNGNTIQVVEFQANKGIDFSVHPETGAKLGDVEIKELDGNADTILKTTLEDKKLAILDGFIKFFTESSGNKTVEQSESERTAGESMAASLSQDMEHYLNRIHDLMCKFAGEKTEGYISTNKEFIDSGLTDIVYKMLSDLYMDETIDREAFLTEIQSYGLLKTIDIQKLKDRLTANGVS